MSETTDLAVLEIKPEQAPALYVPNGLDGYLEQIRQLASEVPDVSTKKGRERIGSLARMVGSSKKAIEEPGRVYLKHLKEAVKPAEEELRRFTRECDTIRDKILAPRTEWDAEQDRIAAEEQMIAWHVEALEMNEAHDKAAAEKFEADHEVALLLNEKFDRDAAEAKAEAERQRIAHDEEIKRQAVEQARIEAEQKAQQEREAAAQRERHLQAKAEQAERDRIAAQESAEREAREAQERTAKLAQEAREQAEREKQAAIDAEQRKAKAAEDARLAEEKRIADEAAARAANEAHRKKIGAEVVTALLGRTSLTREQAIEVLIALKDNQIPHTRITY